MLRPAVAGATFVVLCSLLGTVGGIAPAAADPPPYVPSELVPSRGSPGHPASGWAGKAAEAPDIESLAPGFGTVAARSGVGLRSYRYSTLHGNASTLDVYTPRGLVRRHGGHAPTAVLVHGGAWQMGDRVDLEPRAVQLARSLGAVVVSVNYRLATDAPWPAQREDVDSAVRFLRDNADDLNIDTGRVVLLGSSAGGQIAAAAATAGAGSQRFRGLITLSGLLDPELMASQDPDYSDGVVPDKLLRCMPADCPDRYADASAYTALDPADPPSLLFHSHDETPWDPTQAQEFSDASNAAGVPSALVVLPGDRHGIDTWKDAWPVIRAWLVDRFGLAARAG